MPYSIKKQGSKWAIKKKGGKTVGQSNTKEKAKSSIRARYMGNKK